MKNLLISIGLMSLSSTAYAAPITTVSVLPVTQIVNTGQSVSVGVYVTNVTDLYAFQLDISFDPRLLSASAVTEGSLLPGAGTTSFLPGTIDDVAGTIVFNADSLIGAIPGVTGGGVLLTVDFNALNGGVSAINLANVFLLDSTFVNISETNANGAVTVQGTAITPEPPSLQLLVLGMCTALLPMIRKRIAPFS